MVNAFNSSLRAMIVVSCVSGINLVLTCGAQAGSTGAAGPPLKTWIDKSTGHRIIRLSDQPGSHGLYFNTIAFTPDGKQVVYEANRDAYVVNVDGQGSHLLARGPLSSLAVSPVETLLYFTKSHDQHLYVADIASGELRQVGLLPRGANISSINSDGTLLAGSYIESSGSTATGLTLPNGVKPSKKARERARFDAHLPMVLFTVDLHTLSVNPILHTTAWLNHVQFSPTDPSLLMYCHEGPWNEVDRIWTIRADGSHNKLVHERTLEMKNETAGHEFWDSDGKTVWYDLQMPKGQTFFLASSNTDTGEKRRYQMDRSQWSIHFNGDWKSGLFCGDGASWFGAASAPDGQWIELYHLKSSRNSPALGGNIKQGVIESEHLVNLSAQDYNDEPNVHFSPDHKFVVFTSNMLGPDYVFAVEVARSPEYKKIATAHVFKPNTVSATAQNAASATIQVVDGSNKPIKDAHVTVTSLDTKADVGKYVTDVDGKTSPITIDKELHRYVVTCRQNACNTTVTEQFLPPFSRNLIIRTKQPTADLEFKPSTLKTTLTLLDSTGHAIPKIEVLVRAPDASIEAWYTTNESGSVSFVLPTDPAIVTAFVSWNAHVYKFSSACSVRSDDANDGITCIKAKASSIVTIPRP